MTASGLLINDRLVDVPGLTVVPPASHGGPSWAKLSVGDYRMRHTTWVRQIVVHSTGGNWPMPIIPGAGPGGEGFRYADIWATDPTHSAAHIVVESNGTVVCLADLAIVCAYHAEMCNDWSVGIEMTQHRDDTMHQATLDATARLVQAICEALSIPFQVCSPAYHSEPLPRMEVVTEGHRHQLGGPDCIGVFGHRDSTSTRGRGDPGDAIYSALTAIGAEPLDYANDQDLHLGAARQSFLNSRGSHLVVDGLVGPASLREAKRQGFASWRQVPPA